MSYAPTEARDQPVNPDPSRYQRRNDLSFSHKATEALRLIESEWMPRDEDEPVQARRKQPLSLQRDLRGYHPQRLGFALPHPQSEMNDDWFERLFETLRRAVQDFSTAHFRTALAAPAGLTEWNPWNAPWPESFLQYAEKMARQDNVDGGWNRLLTDPLQRSYLVAGILAKALDEHVLSQLLFGGTTHQQEGLAQWDRVMMQSEGYYRKAKRSEEVRFFLEDDILTPHFWDEVDRLTAQLTALLLPLLNMQRKHALDDGRSRQPGLPVVYQELHDAVALAGYASLCMARSTSIFWTQFPLLGQAWDIEQDKVADNDQVYQPSLKKATDADRAALDADTASTWDASKNRSLPLRTPKVKIAVWPTICRYKPHWRRSREHNGGRLHISSTTPPDGDTTVILCKSRGVYYAGQLTDDADAAESEPTLAAYVHNARKRRWTGTRRAVLVVVALCLLLLPVLVDVPKSRITYPRDNPLSLVQRYIGGWECMANRARGAVLWFFFGIVAYCVN